MSVTKKSPEAPSQMANIAVTASSVLPSPGALYRDCLAYEAIIQGQPVALIDTGSTFSVASASGLSTVRLADASINFKVYGIAANSAAAGQPIKVIVSDPALGISGVVTGDVLYLSPTPGGLTSTYADLTTGKFVSVIGVGIGANKINMAIIRSDAAK